MTQKLQAQPRSWQASEKLREAIRNREEFTTNGALRGHAAYMGSPATLPYSTGRLSAEYVEQFRSDHPTYAVYSYATPIAWYGDRGWIVPDEGYSATTSRHQTHVRVAVP